MVKGTNDVSWTPEMLEKGGYPHFMLKEIHEQPKALRNALSLKSEVCQEAARILNDSQQVYITAAGTSNHAGLAGRYMFTKLSRVRTQNILSSEFPELTGELLCEDDAVLAISQSGETADTINAVKHAKRQGAKVISVTNVVGSTLSKLSDYTIYTYAGPEYGLAATKTFLVQVACLSLLSLDLSLMRGSLSDGEVKTLREGLMNTPHLVDRTIKRQDRVVRDIAYQYANKQSFFYLGRGISTATAMEGALKLKETAYIHAEAYPAGESRHGPIALIEPGFPVIIIAPPDETYDRLVKNLGEVKAHQAKIISVVQEDDSEVRALSDHSISILETTPMFSPITYVVPLQLFAYFVAFRRGYNPDKPRYLVKAITEP
ncbi:MAG: isomerizing glutamine--fructose-6-phosphate transaminase [Candidatus Freyarchaeota archaeon]|nr:isomerizing glutamine--fructose-6-phosphate transaminase [Candidatus Jordarchaeia archaeon]MBS7268295.1 isomerizing glutamine--fructose-6-phosphate transaminase [Candidatus Jordarchaeia archaeon]MBS7279223.1 isomerizing glutamine--fructose-6-phosphate transaminase [Candidatus Jordarchaeia archaeon]